MHHGRRKPDSIRTPATRTRSRRRALPFALVALSAIACASFVSIGVAGALLQPFRLSPTSGPPGTVVGVSGTACMPGPVASATLDYVKITSTTLPISVDIPVSAGGSWTGSFTVPASSLGLPGLVAATCFTDGLPSTTTYSPQSFTVTGATTPTKPPTTPTTRHKVGTPAPTPGAGAGGAPSHPAVPDAPVGNGNGAGSGAGNGAVSANPSGGAGSAQPGTPAAAAAAAKLATASGAGKAVAAGSSTGGHHHLWLWWILLALIVLAAISALIWWRHRNDGDVETVPKPS